MESTTHRAHSLLPRFSERHDTDWNYADSTLGFDREIRLDLPTASELRTRLLYKRTLDVAVSVSVMVMGFPIFVAVYVAVALSSRGSVIYSCSRVGRNGAAFRCYKFRTMVAGADERLKLVLLASPELAREFEREFKLRNDPRVTKLGRFLRRTSLDELPQFWNVLKGDMSVVGWRPLVPAEIERYGDMFPVVASLRPGVTGLWQVSGRNDVSYEERVQFDVRYTCDAGLRTDLEILYRTVTQMVNWRSNGAY